MDSESDAKNSRPTMEYLIAERWREKYRHVLQKWNFEDECWHVLWSFWIT